MKRAITTSEDGSKTLLLEDYNESYHSRFGALSESRHIFAGEGLSRYLGDNPNTEELSIFEAGLGTGLNCLLTALEIEKFKSVKRVKYLAVEKYPITPEEASMLDYPSLFGNSKLAGYIYETIHSTNWGCNTPLSEKMELLKICSSFEQYFPAIPHESINIIYYDAFSPETQPELWQVEIFISLFRALKPGGVLVTYSSKGIVKRALRAVGFEVKRVAGPKGKKHILRASKA